MTTTEPIKSDCRFYRGDRPCSLHKREGVKCSACSHYAPFAEKILIVKLEAMGDVLRTTSILPGLRKKYPSAQITWITAPSALPLFPGNPYVDRVLPLLPDGLLCVLSETFTLALNLDTAPVSASLLARASAKEKRGFSIDKRGQVCALSAPAEEWLRMSVFDDVKKANRRTYQEIIHEILGLGSPPGEIVLNLSEEETAFARSLVARRSLTHPRPWLGLNTGGGGRWRFKRWSKEATLALARLCAAEFNIRLFLFGGPEEEERNDWLMSCAGDILVDTGCRNSVREFFSLLDLCDLIVTSDTLALHAATGLKKKVVALFGPTSAAEIELYGRGEKVVAPVPCRCCYLQDCRVQPNCMESITPELVLSAIRKLLKS
jgi:heptosyltransferase-2